MMVFSAFMLSIILLLAGDVSFNSGRKKTFQKMCFSTTNLRYVINLVPFLFRCYKHINTLALTETRLSVSDSSVCLTDICPHGFCLCHDPRRSGGGVAFLVLKHIK